MGNVIKSTEMEIRATYIAVFVAGNDQERFDVVVAKITIAFAAVTFSNRN